MSKHSAVPATGTEQVTWRSRFGQEGVYRAAVPAALAGVDLRLPSALVAQVCDASVVLARAGESLRRYQRPFVLIEAAASSRLEGIVTGALATVLADGGWEHTDEARLTAAAANSTWLAHLAPGPLDRVALDAHRALLGSDPAWSGRAGKWREQPVWIGGPFSTPMTAVYVPPTAERVPAAMADLTRLVQRDDVPALALAAVVHAQFETIHPFGDGNGRVGRALVHSVLARSSLAAPAPAPVSLGLLRDKRGYIEALQAFRTGDAEPIVSAFVEAAHLAAATARQAAEELDALGSGARDALATVARPQASAWRVLGMLVEHPAIDHATLRTVADLPSTAASRALEQLERAGVLSETTGAARNRVWVHRGVVSVLERALARPANGPHIYPS